MTYNAQREERLRRLGIEQLPPLTACSSFESDTSTCSLIAETSSLTIGMSGVRERPVSSYPIANPPPQRLYSGLVCTFANLYIPCTDLISRTVYRSQVRNAQVAFLEVRLFGSFRARDALSVELKFFEW